MKILAWLLIAGALLAAGPAAAHSVIYDDADVTVIYDWPADYSDYAYRVYHAYPVRHRHYHGHDRHYRHYRPHRHYHGCGHVQYRHYRHHRERYRGH